MILTHVSFNPRSDPTLCHNSTDFTYYNYHQATTSLGYGFIVYLRASITTTRAVQLTTTIISNNVIILDISTRY